MQRKVVHIFLILSIMLVIHQPLSAQSIKKIYIANDEHTDYMWTGNEQQYDSVFLKMLDYYLAAIDSTKNNPPHLQARFNCDGTWWLRTFEKFRSPQEFNKLVAAIRSGHISCPMNTLVSTYGAQPAEAVIRGMMYAGTLSRKYGIDFPMAVSMENQTQPLGLSSLWAGSGARYSWKGICGCASRIANKSLAKRNHQLYHYTGLDSSSVLMKWYSFVNNTSLGGYAELRHQSKTVDRVTDISKNIRVLDQLMDDQSAAAEYPYRIAAGFGYGWDDLDTYVSDEFIAAARLNSTAETKVIVSNQQDFFEDIEQTYRQIPSETVSYGNEWDTYCASMNETTARVRRAVVLLRTAEALTSVLKDKGFYYSPEITAARKSAFESLGLYWEHDWTADGPVTREERAAWQEKIEKNITAYSELLHKRSAEQLANQIHKGNGNLFYVFNPLGWSRSDYADVPHSSTEECSVIDISTGEEAMAQKIIKNGQQFIRIWAKDIPAVGYRIFEMRKGASKKQRNTAVFKNGKLQTGAYNIRIARSGAITSWIDLATKKELVKKVNNRYLNDAGFTLINEGDELMMENDGPVSATVKAVSSHPFKHTTRITVFKNNRRIAIEDSILQNFRELKTWAYSFNFNNPVTRHEELSAVLTAATASNGGHYADNNARYDWLTMNQFVNMSEGNQNITLSNIDCSFFKLGESRFDSLAFSSSQINALAGGQTDKINPANSSDTSYLGIYAQNGHTAFRYQFALTADAGNFNPAAAMLFALEHQHPFVTGFTKGADQSNSPAVFSLLNIADPELILWSIKPAEDDPGQGLIIRVRNMNGKRKKPVIQFTDPIQSAWQVTHIENNIAGLPVQHTTIQPAIKGLQLISLKIIPAKK